MSTGQLDKLTSAASGRGGQHVLAAELLLFLAIVGVRAVAQYGPGDKKNLPADQYGPLFILGNGLAVFFVLAFLAARGGTAARLAGVGGLIIDIALLLKSAPHLELVANELAAPRKYVPVSLAPTEASEADVTQQALVGEYAGGLGDLPPPPKGSSVASAMRYARKALSRYGLSAGQWNDLVKLWNQESGWSNTATNPSSGAYGIAQALPPTKYPKDAQEAGGSDVAAQINWGLKYIKDTYGSLAAAWSHEQHFGWY